MNDGGVGQRLMTIVLTALVFSGCLGDAPTEGIEGPGDSSPDENPATMERFSPGWPALDDAVIRPGVKIVAGPARTPVGPVGDFSGLCTANFVFSSPDNRTLYLGTASHCHMGATIGDPVSIASGAVTGTLVYCAWGTVDASDTCPSKTMAVEGWANDFALVELPDDARGLVHPALLHWGGPTGLLTSLPGPEQHVLTYGNTLLRDADQDGAGSNAADATEGLTTSSISETPFTPGYAANWSTFARFASPRAIGDSGSAVILADGPALGAMTQITPNEGAMRITNLAAAIEYIHNNTDLRIELKTWETLAEPSLPLPAPDAGVPRREGAER